MMMPYKELPYAYDITNLQDSDGILLGHLLH